jgi:DNA-binding MarR family transcriptional regulator
MVEYGLPMMSLDDDESHGFRAAMAAGSRPPPATLRAHRGDMAAPDLPRPRPRPGAQKDLAASLVLDGSSVVRLLDALEAAGLIESADRRAKTIAVTSRGLSIIDRVEAISRDVRTATLVGLSQDETEFATRVLDLVCQNLAKQQDSEACRLPTPHLTSSHDRDGNRRCWRRNGHAPGIPKMGACHSGSSRPPEAGTST